MITHSVTIPNWLDLILALPILTWRMLRCGYPYRRIPLTQGQYAIVDPDDYYELIKYKWCARKTKYGYYYASRGARGRGNIQMHRYIMELRLKAKGNTLSADLMVDHKNGNTLDNRKANLRPATAAQNSRNRRPYGRTSKYKGVHYHPYRGIYYRACITVDGKMISLGVYKDELSAAKAYDKAARKYYGEFAWLNFP